MNAQHGPTEPSPHAVIEAALTRIAAAFPALTFADARQTEEAQHYVTQGLQAIRYHLTRATPPTETPPPTRE